MPLKELFSKAPIPLPPSEEPWPKPPSQEGVSSHSNSNNYKHSPLYSATSRPTLDEFLRTNYLMIPEFVMQVNQAKKAAAIEESGQSVQNTSSQQNVVNFGQGVPVAFPGAVQNQTVSCNIEEVQAVENKEMAPKDPRSTAEKRKTNISGRLSTAVSEKQIIFEEIQIPPPAKPKPRVKKVMKGGSLVTIPAPQPRNKTAQGTFEDAGGGVGNKTGTSSAMPISSEGRENAVDISDKRSLKDSVDQASGKETYGNYSGLEDDLGVFHLEAGDLPEEVPPKGGDELQSKVLAGKFEQKLVSLNSVSSTNVFQESKSKEIAISLDSSQDSGGKIARSSDEDSDILHSRVPQVTSSKASDGACDKGLSQESSTAKNSRMCELRSLTSKVSIEKGKEDLMKGDITKKGLMKEDLMKEALTKEDLTKKGLMKEDLVKEDITKKGLMKEDLMKEDLMEEDIMKEDFPKEDITKEDLMKVDIMKEGSMKEGLRKEGLRKEDLIDEPTIGGKSASKAKEIDSHPERKSVTCIIDPNEREISGDTMEQADEELSDRSVPLDTPICMATSEDFVVDLDDPHHDTLIISSNQKINFDDDREENECARESSTGKCQEIHEDNVKFTTTEVEGGCEITGRIVQKNDCGNSSDIMGVNVDGFNELTNAQSDGNDRKSDNENESTLDNDQSNVDNCSDCDNDDDDDDDDGNEDGGLCGASVKDKPPVEQSDEDYAELIMEDSNSEEEEDDFLPVNSDDSDDEEGEIKSDYEPEDMNLDSDAESSVGGITFYQNTTLGENRKCSRQKQREKRRAKNKRKKAAKKRIKAAKKAFLERKRTFDPSSKAKNCTEKQTDTPASQKSGGKEASKIARPETQKSTEASAKPREEKTAPQCRPAGQSAMEEGSLLSMVSSFAVDVTVAASEKLALNRTRGGQHAKKLKKAKRRAAALERIQRGEPPPRPRRVQHPKRICNYYIEGKCRKGEECPFRHDRSALVKKRELCKFYVSNRCFQGDDCPYMHNSFPCKYFHTGSACWADHCKFSHDALTEETRRILQLYLNPPAEDTTRLSQDKNLPNAGSETPGKSEQIAGTSTSTQGTLQESASPPYNLRESTRKRRLSTSGAGDDHVTDGKASRQESPGYGDANSDGQGSLFLPGLYKDLSM